MTNRPSLTRPPKRPLTRRAHAKINLALAVGAARAGDALHPIASWMAPIGLCDTVTIQRLDAGEPSRFEVMLDPSALRPGPIDWPLDRDLAVRAVRAIEAEAGIALPVAMRVEKRIPVGAGLGGGSSDAAAALLGVRALFGLEISDDRLSAIALALGSDVPFFLGEGPALVTGHGERVERTPPVAGIGAIALLVPPFGCDTGAVYRSLDTMERAGFRPDAVAQLARGAVFDDAGCFNDLAGAAEKSEPALAQLRAAIESAASVRAHITGSGSAMFVCCASPEEGERVVEAARRFAGPIAGLVTRITP
jgi:4-diphosphocytidyl-2-C-methyl-D-erythritol kinase